MVDETETKEETILEKRFTWTKDILTSFISLLIILGIAFVGSWMCVYGAKEQITFGQNVLMTVLGSAIAYVLKK